MFAWLFGRRMRASVPIVLYSRRGCGLCQQMKAELARARLAWSYTITEVDIDEDPDLAREFGEAIPVLWIGGRKAFKGRMTGAEFEKKFERLALEWWRARLLSGEGESAGGGRPT